jgi:hypothetical protein
VPSPQVRSVIEHPSPTSGRSRRALVASPDPTIRDRRRRRGARPNGPTSQHGIESDCLNRFKVQALPSSVSSPEKGREQEPPRPILPPPGVPPFLGDSLGGSRRAAPRPHAPRLRPDRLDRLLLDLKTRTFAELLITASELLITARRTERFERCRSACFGRPTGERGLGEGLAACEALAVAAEPRPNLFRRPGSPPDTAASGPGVP